MFLTRQLWNALRFPLRRHPIFVHARRSEIKNRIPSRVWRWSGIIALIGIILFAIVVPLPAILTTLGIVIGLPLLTIAFNGTVLGAILVTMISIRIENAHKSNRFDLMSITPDGALAGSWLLATGTIHRHHWLNTVYRLVTWVVMLVLVLLALAIFMLFIGTVRGESALLRQQQITVLRDAISIGLIVGALWLDHIQSIVIAVLCGMVMPRITHDEVQLRSIVVIVYLMIQVCTYLAVFVIYRLIDIILIGLMGNIFATSLIITVLTIISFYFLREAITGILLRLMLIKYNASIEDYQHLINSNSPIIR